MFNLGDTVTFTPYRSKCGDALGYPVFESDLRDHAGQTATVTAVLISRRHPEDAPMYGVTFTDGYVGEAVFADELEPVE